MSKDYDPLDNASPLWERDEKRDEAIRAIDELVDDFGEMQMISALQDSKLASRIDMLSGTTDQLRIAREMFAELLAAQNIGLAVDLMSIALGFGERTGVTVTSIAERNGCTKQNASRMLDKITKSLGIAKLPCQQTEKTRNAYRQQNKRNYA